MMKRMEWTTALILFALLLVGCACTGCRGGLFGGAGAESGKPGVNMYTFNIAANAKSAIVVGSAGTQSYMPQLPEGATDAKAGNSGQMNQWGTGGSMNRTAEMDLSAALQSLAGNTQTQAGQTPAITQRQGTATATGTATQTPTLTDTTAIPIAVTGQGTASPTAQAAGPASTPAQAVAPPPAPAQPIRADVQVQYENAVATAKAMGTGGAADGSNTPLQAAAAQRVAELKAQLDAMK